MCGPRERDRLDNVHQHTRFPGDSPPDSIFSRFVGMPDMFPPDDLDARFLPNENSVDIALKAKSRQMSDGIQMSRQQVSAYTTFSGEIIQADDAPGQERIFP